ncbi:MAG TPA: prolyl oligopeptidase family serine peptidase [Acidimicrobiales bacterium]|nr:prolyl oligopeptidase family serine peptidase [Acidimicrobiales bacterium]
MSFPRRSARTRRFTLGGPRGLRVAADGSRVAFLRSTAGDDPVHSLWVLDVDRGRERLVADPRGLLGGGPEHVPQAERDRRERARESATGIVSYGADRLLHTAAFALSGQLFVANLVGGTVRGPLSTPGPAVGPWPAPAGGRTAFVCERAVYVSEGDGTHRRLVPGEPGGEDLAISWGLAEFVAAEEMGRLRGFWWAPDGERLAVAGVDETQVPAWHLADPTEPGTAPRRVRYPAAGTANADVALYIVALDGSTTEVAWDHTRFPYLARVRWDEGRPLTLLVQSRDQRTTRVLTADPRTGETTLCREDHDDLWLDLVPGAPAWTSGGALVHTAHVGDRRRLLLDGEPVSPPHLEVREVVDAAGEVVFTASEDPTEVHVWRVAPGATAERLTTTPGVHGAAAGGGVVAVVSLTLDSDGADVGVWREGERVASVASLAERPPIRPKVGLLAVGPRELRTAVLLPDDGRDEPLPVLLDPYGGPGHQRVLRNRLGFLEAQWWADQGFAVVVADGRGTGGRGRSWDRAIHRDLAGPPLEDQVDALHAAAEEHPRLDLGRVAIRGWSFGGFLAALAVLRRPEVFHAAVAGAPVTDWRLYDTHYTERYLGLPDEEPEAYRRSSLLDDAERLERPLLLIHGLGDDNVVVAHTFQLSRALLEAGRSHAVLPLSGITHMAAQEVVAENLLLLQVEFLRRALGVGP